MTTLFILTWLAFESFWTTPIPNQQDAVHRFELRNHKGEVITVIPRKPHWCSVKEEEYESITWHCSGPAEIIHKPRKEDSYFWVGGSNELSGFSGGVVGGGWRVVR